MAKKVEGANLATCKTLPQPIPLSTFHGKVVAMAMHYICITLVINSHTFPKQKFLIILLKDEVIIGNNWFIKHKVALLLAIKTLLWPEDWPPLTQYSPVIPVLWCANKINLNAQVDMIDQDCRTEQAKCCAEWIQKILQHPNWCEPPVLAPIDNAKETDILTINIVHLTTEITDDPHQECWSKLPMLDQPIWLLAVEPDPH